MALPLNNLSADVLTYKYAVQRADGTLMLEHGESRLLSVPEAGMGERSIPTGISPTTGSAGSVGAAHRRASTRSAAARSGRPR